MNVFKIYGLEKSGVTALNNLVINNFGHVATELHGWQHGEPVLTKEFAEYPTKFILAVRNPLVWLVAYYNSLKSEKPSFIKDASYSPKSFKEFLRTPSFNYENPVIRWNVLHRQWLDMIKQRGGLVINGEELLKDVKVVLEKISLYFGFVTGTNWNIRDLKLKNDTYDITYISMYDQDDINFVKELVDEELLNELNYQNLEYKAVVAPIVVNDTLPHYKYTQMFNMIANTKLEYPGNAEGRGIVVCAGGNKYFTCAWVLVNMLRKLGCTLPIEFWHLGEKEVTTEMRRLVADLNVKFVDAHKVRKWNPVRTLHGWELKPYAIIHSSFKEVMLLDADNVPVVDPTFLFDTPQYQETGAIFWPDYGRLASTRKIWSICEIPYQNEPEFETGQIVVNKEKCWHALQLTMHMNEYSDFYYDHIHGDKETFHLAWRKLKQPYSMPSKGIHSLSGTMCQHDFDGNRIFQHRNMAKWSLVNNKHVKHFEHESTCFEFLSDLQHKWKQSALDILDGDKKEIYDRIVQERFFQYIREGTDIRLLEFLDNFDIGEGKAGLEQRWSLVKEDDIIHLQISGTAGIICKLAMVDDLVFKGHWNQFERMPITISLPT